MTSREEQLIGRLERLADTVESWINPEPAPQDWSAWAYRWTRDARQAQLRPVAHPQLQDLDELLGIERQKRELERNTRQFLVGLPANNALLWGARGTGKSSLVRALLGRYGAEGLRVIEVDRADLVDLPDIVSPLHGRAERFIVYADDLSFEADDASYKALKATIEGSLAAPPDICCRNIKAKTSRHVPLMVKFIRQRRLRRKFRCLSVLACGCPSIHSTRRSI